jgi:hypothetical protein
MNTRRAMLTIALLVAGCGGTQPSPSIAPPSAAPPAATPTAPAATQAAPSIVPSAAPVSILEGTWATDATTCDQQNAAVSAAGFTRDDLEAAGWDKATCGSLMHGSAFTVRFAGERLVHFSDDVVGWDGVFRVVDADTFEAGDSGAGYYITYEFAIDGDQLTIDMVRDDYPASSPEELIGEQLAQTVLYESAPFTRVP